MADDVLQSDTNTLTVFGTPTDADTVFLNGGGWTQGTPAGGFTPYDALATGSIMVTVLVEDEMVANVTIA